MRGLFHVGGKMQKARNLAGLLFVSFVLNIVTLQLYAFCNAAWELFGVRAENIFHLSHIHLFGLDLAVG